MSIILALAIITSVTITTPSKGSCSIDSGFNVSGNYRAPCIDYLQQMADKARVEDAPVRTIPKAPMITYRHYKKEN